MRRYQQTVDWMFQQLPMYQQIGSKAYRVDLSNIKRLTEHLREPHFRFKSLHIGGTNGKGSVSHMLASVLQEEGYKVGLYTSPHLKDFKERIKINGKEITEDAVIEFIEKNRPFLEKGSYSFFEMTVGMAFDYFAAEKIDIAVVEVGLGGRLDSTNILSPEVSVITNIGLDHTTILGDTLPKIAEEKAGIIKESVPVVIGESSQEVLPVFRRVARERNAPLYLAESVTGELPSSDLKGAYQRMNIRTVLTTLEVLRESGWRISRESTVRGLKKVVSNTGLRGRWEILKQYPKVICDTAHNQEGLHQTMAQVEKEGYARLHLVIGVVRDKDLDTLLPIFPEHANYYYCRPNVPRGLEAEILREKGLRYGRRGLAYSSVKQAYQAALENADKKDFIYIGGSTFTVAEII